MAPDERCIIIGRGNGKSSRDLEMMVDIIEEQYIQSDPANQLDAYEKFFVKGPSPIRVFEDRDYDPFVMAGMQITDELRTVLGSSVIQFKKFAEAILAMTKTNTIAMEEASNSLMNALKQQQELIINQPKIDYKKKHKPWEKNRFYD